MRQRPSEPWAAWPEMVVSKITEEAVSARFLCVYIMYDICRRQTTYDKAEPFGMLQWHSIHGTGNRIPEWQSGACQAANSLKLRQIVVL